MSLVKYSKFGTIVGDGLISSIGEQGPVGIGYRLTVDGNYDINNKDLTAVDNINAQSLNLPSDLTTDNTNTNLLTLDALGNVEVRTVASLPVVNPFDQDLNTTNDVVFNSVDSDILISGVGLIKIGDSTTVDSILKITDVASEKLTTGLSGLTVQSNSFADLMLQSDRDNASGGYPRVYLNKLGNTACTLLQVGASNTLDLYSGVNGVSTSGGYSFNIAQPTGTTDSKSTFSSISNLLTMNNTNLSCGRDIILNDNNITGITNITLDTITAKTTNITLNNHMDVNSKNLVNVQDVNIQGAPTLSGLATDETVLSSIGINGSNVLKKYTIPVFGNNYELSTTGADATGTSGTTYTQANYFTTATLPIGTYMVVMSCDVKNTSDEVVKMRFTVDDTSTAIYDERYIDCTDNPAFDHRVDKSYVMVLASGVQANLIIEYAKLSGTSTVYCGNTQITIYRLA